MMVVCHAVYTRPQGIDVGKRLREFHLRHYSSHCMTVAVISCGESPTLVAVATSHTASLSCRG